MKRQQKVTIVLGSVLALYVLSYGVLSLAGNYAGYLSISGRIRYESGLAVPDVREWEPYGVFKSNRGYNFLGIFYAPLVDLDRRFWHKAVDVFSGDGTAQVVPGTVVGWGNNKFGQATGTPSKEPAVGVVLFEGRALDDVVSVAAGQFYSLALKSDGTVVGWGSNFRGHAIGSDKEFPRTASGRVRIEGNLLTNVMAISARAHSLGLQSNGTVVAWGRSPNGPVGSPIDVPSGLGDVVAVATGENYDLALGKDGMITTWGLGQRIGFGYAPPSLADVIAIAISDSEDGHGLALLKGGSVRAWALRHDSSCIVAGATNIVAVAAGTAHFLALRDDGVVLEWGTYSPGIGGGFVGRPAEDLVSRPAVINGKVLNNVIAISASGTRSLALKRDGTVIAWGTDWKHQGENPVQLDVPAGLKGVVAISTGDGFSLAITTNNPALPSVKATK